MFYGISKLRNRFLATLHGYYHLKEAIPKLLVPVFIGSDF